VIRVTAHLNALSGIWAEGYVFPCSFFLSSSPSQRRGAIVGEWSVVLQDFRGNGGVRIAINQQDVTFNTVSLLQRLKSMVFFVNFTFLCIEVITYRTKLCGVRSYYKGSTLSLQDDLVQIVVCKTYPFPISSACVRGFIPVSRVSKSEWILIFRV
jgi:hypothetical protein